MNLEKYSEIRWLTLLLASAVLILELAVVSKAVNAYGLIDAGQASGILGVLGYSGQIAKWLVLAIVILLVLLQKRIFIYLSAWDKKFELKRSLVWGVFQVLSYGAFYYFSLKIFAGREALNLPNNWQIAAWFLFGFLTFSIWCLALIKFENLMRFILREKNTIFFALGAAGLVWWMAYLSVKLWEPMAEGAFWLTSIWLAIFGAQDVYSDAETKILGINDFYIQVADACSGFEGIGLILAFTSVYLYANRKEFRFPFAYLLFPIGAICIWILNSLRIALLVLLGAHVSPEIAVGGFHSQAGWITFIATSVGLLWVAGRSRYFTYQHETNISVTETTISSEGAYRDTATVTATIVPIVVLLAATLITSTFSAGFDYLYPIRFLVVLLAIAWVWRDLKFPKWHFSWLPIATGVAVAVLWAFMLGGTPEDDFAIKSGLASMEPVWGWAWLLCRFLGTAITVPIAEELAFRGYLLCRLSQSSNFVSGSIPRVYIAIVISSIAFGALHGAWIAGTVAGLAYGLLRWRSQSITAPIIAHGLTNALLFAFAYFFGRWGLL